MTYPGARPYYPYGGAVPSTAPKSPEWREERKGGLCNPCWDDPYRECAKACLGTCECTHGLWELTRSADVNAPSPSGNVGEPTSTVLAAEGNTA